MDCVQINHKQQMKEAYKKAVELNNIKLNELAYLHKRTPVAIEKYLYAESRYPDFQCCYELYWLIKSIHGKLPIELARFINRSNNRAFDSAKKIGKQDREKCIVLGEKKQRPPLIKYLFNGEEVSVVWIAKRFAIDHNSVRQRLKNIEQGSEVSHLDFTKQKRGRKPKPR